MVLGILYLFQKEDVRCKWVYITKYALYGSVERHKDHLVSKGFSQVEGIQYNGTFSSVAKINSTCLVLALAASHKWEVHGIIYMEQHTWNNHLAMYKMTPTLFFTVRNLFMVLSKILELGMPN
jgi:hypothetical protein